jgi:TorA maturation chaperone TorD
MMQAVDSVSGDNAVALACEFLYRFLSAALSDPYTTDLHWVLEPRDQQVALGAADLLRAEAGGFSQPLGFGELPPSQLDLTSLRALEPLTTQTSQAEYDRVFGLVLSRECPPYETEYDSSSEPFYRAQQLADIAGFYRAFGLQTALAAPERPDHLALELEFMAFLLWKERMAWTAADDQSAEKARVCASAQRSFLRDHLAWWVPSFATGLCRKAEKGFYLIVGQALATFMPLERVRLDVTVPRMPLRPALIERPEEQSGCVSCIRQS